MEYRLLKIIVNPAMIAVWLFGLTLAYVTGAYEDTWFQIKFVLVVNMSGLHGFLAATVKRFAKDANTRSTRFYRIINEDPFLLIIGIVIMVVIMRGLHWFFAATVKCLANDANTLSTRFFRIILEVPFLLFIVFVIMV